MIAVSASSDFDTINIPRLLAVKAFKVIAKQDQHASKPAKQN